MHWFYLFIAILGEILATSFLKSTFGFTRLIPSLIVVAGYGIAFFFLSLALQHIYVGIAYAIWAGAGIVFISLIAFFIHQQKIDLPGIIGITLIIIGVIIINAFSKTGIH